VYHCNIDGNTYKVTGSDTAVLVTDPAQVDAGKNTFISNWRNFHLEGGSTGSPAGEGPPPIGAHQPGGKPMLFADPGPPEVGSGTRFTHQELIDHFMAEGYSKAGAIGIVANLEAESGLKTSGPTGGQGEEGLAQWKGNRLHDLQRYAAEHHLDWRSKGAQLGFLDQELSTKYPGLSAQLKTATDPQQAAHDFCAAFEVPTLDNGTPNYPTYSDRQQRAARIAAGNYGD
jgi:hypothetical protein